MALTTLLGVLAIGLQGGQTPVQITMETKIYEVTGSDFKLPGKVRKVDSGHSSKDVTFQIVRGADEKKLSKDKGLKVISAPILRTLSGQRAEITTQSTGTDATIISKLGFLIDVQKDSRLGFRMTASFEKSSSPDSSWNFQEDTTLKQDECYVLVATSGTRKILYLVKAHVVEE